MLVTRGVMMVIVRVVLPVPSVGEKSGDGRTGIRSRKTADRRRGL